MVKGLELWSFFRVSQYVLKGSQIERFFARSSCRKQSLRESATIFCKPFTRIRLVGDSSSIPEVDTCGLAVEKASLLA